MGRSTTCWRAPHEAMIAKRDPVASGSPVLMFQRRRVEGYGGHSEAHWVSQRGTDFPQACADFVIATPEVP